MFSRLFKLDKQKMELRKLHFYIDSSQSLFVMILNQYIIFANYTQIINSFIII